MKKTPRGRCKAFILVWENGGFVYPSPSCEQPATFKDESGYLCERHRAMVAKTKASTLTDEEMVDAAEAAAQRMVEHYRELRELRIKNKAKKEAWAAKRKK